MTTRLQSRIAARRFTHDRYCGALGYNAFSVWDHKRNKPRDGFTVVGWVDARLIPFRPFEGRVAVMLCEEPRRERVMGSTEFRMVGGVDFWIHVQQVDG